MFVSAVVVSALLLAAASDALAQTKITRDEAMTYMHKASEGTFSFKAWGVTKATYLTKVQLQGMEHIADCTFDGSKPAKDAVTATYRNGAGLPAQLTNQIEAQMKVFAQMCVPGSAIDGMLGEEAKDGEEFMIEKEVETPAGKVTRIHHQTAEKTEYLDFDIKTGRLVGGNDAKSGEIAMTYTEGAAGQPALMKSMGMSGNVTFTLSFEYEKSGEFSVTKTASLAAGQTIPITCAEWKLEGKYAKPVYKAGATTDAGSDDLALLRAIDKSYWCLHADEKLKSATSTVTLPAQGKWTPKVTIGFTRDGGRTVKLDNPDKGKTEEECRKLIAADLAFVESYGWGYSLVQRLRDHAILVAAGKVADTTLITFTPLDPTTAAYEKKMVTVKGNVVTQEEIVVAGASTVITYKTKTVAGKLVITGGELKPATGKAAAMTVTTKAGKTYTEVTELKRDKSVFKFGAFKVEMEK